MKPIGVAGTANTASTHDQKVRIEYCTSWGMQRNYLTIKQFLESEFPALQNNISGGNAPPPPFATLMMKALSFIHILAIAFVFMGEKLFSFVPFVKTTPQWFITAKQYPMQSFVILFFVVPTFVQSFVTTGCFEIMLNGKVVFSKIQSGRFPDGPELIQIFETAGFSH